MATDKNKPVPTTDNIQPTNTIPVPKVSALGLKLAGFDTEPTKVGAEYTESQYTPRVFPQELETLEDRRAALQPWIDKLGNGLLNAGTNAFTSAANNSVGLVFGALESMATMDPSKMWSNEFVEAMTNLSEGVRETNPFYYSEAEKQASVLGGTTYANFWFDKVLGGTGYIAGSLLTGLGAARLFQLGKAAQLAKLEQVAAGELGAAAEGLTAAATEMGRKNLVKEFSLGFAMANGESVIESVETAQQVEDFLIEARQKARDGDMQYAEYADITDDEIQKLKTDAGNSNWLANMVITGGGNLLLLKNFINPGKKAAIREYNELGKTTLQSGAVEYFDRVAAKKQGALLTLGKAAGKGFMEEAAQEGAQFASNIASQEFVKSYNLKNKDWFDSVMTGLAEGIEETLTSKEGLESMLVGGISGAPFGTKGAISEKLAREENTKALVNSLNLDPRFSKAAPKVQAFLSAFQDTQESEEYLKQGDLFNAKNKADLGLNKYIKSLIDTGSLDYFVTRLESLKQGPISELQEFFGEGTTVEDVDKVLNKAKALNELNNSINILYSTAGGTPEQKSFNSMLRDKLFYSAATIKDYERREEAITKELQDMNNPDINNLAGLRAQALNIDKTVIPETIAEEEIEKYLQDLKKTSVETYNKALQAFVDQDPVNGAKVTELLADLNGIDKNKKDFIKYYNALNDPAYAQQLMEAEQALLQNLAQEAEAEEARQNELKKAEKEAALPEELINDVFKKNVSAPNLATDLNGNEVDLSQLSDAELRGLRDEVEQSAGVLGATESNTALREAIEKELDVRDGVITADTLKQELANAKTPEEVQKIVDKAATNNFTVDNEKVKAVFEALLERKKKREAENKEVNTVLSKFKDIREFTNSFVVGDEAQMGLDDILANDPDALDKITLKVTKNPAASSVTRLKGVEYSVSNSPLVMAIQYEGQDIAFIPYFGQFVDENGVILDPTVITYEQWVKLFNPDKNKATPANFQAYQEAYKDSRQFFVYLNENLAKGKSEYSNEEVKSLLSPKINIGFFDIVGASEDTSLSTGYYDLYQDDNGDVIIVDTRAENSKNYTSVNNAHINPATLTIDDKYKPAFEALAERKATGKINKEIIKQRYVALVKHPLGTVSIPGSTLKYEWMPVTPAKANLQNLLDTLKQYQKDKTDVAQISRELNSNTFFSLGSDWNVGLFMNPEHTDFILKFEYKGEEPVYVRIPITEELTQEQFLNNLNKYLIEKQDKLKIAGVELHKYFEKLGLKGISEDNFRVQLPKNIPDLTTEEAIDSFYSILSPNIKRKLSFNFKFNAPFVKATQPVGGTSISSAPPATANPLTTALEVLKNKILSSANPKITLNDATPALKKYGFTDKQISALKQVLADLNVSAVDAVQALIDRLNGKEWDFVLDNTIIDEALSQFAGKEQEFLNAVQGVTPSAQPSIQPQPSAAPVSNIEDKKALGQELISIVWARLAKQGITNADSIIGTRDTIENVDFDKFWSNVTKEDLQNLKKQYENKKKEQLDLYNKFKGAFDPSTGTITSNDTSFFDNKIKVVDAELNALATPQAGSVGVKEGAPVSNKKAEYKREDFPESQVNTRTPVTQKLLDYFADVLGIFKYSGDLSEGTYIGWLQNANPIGYAIAEKLNAPRQAFDIIAKYDAELAAQEGAASTAAKRVNPRSANKFDPTKDDADSSGDRVEKRRDLTQAFAYLKSIFGNSITAREFEALEENLANGKVRYGNFKNALIRLSRFSPEGTEYHEAFHAVFRMFLSDEEIAYYRALGKESLYQALKNEGVSFNKAFADFKRDFFLKNPGVAVTDAELRNLMVEEHLADRFKNWKLKKESAKTGIAKLLSDLWDKFTRLINVMVEGEQADEIDALFAQIDAGKFKNAVQVANQFTNTILPADVSLYAGTRTEEDESGENRVYPVYLPEHITNQIIGTVISKVYNMRKENPNVSYDTLIERAMNDLHKQFELDERFDSLLDSTNEKAIDLLYSLEFALDKNSWVNKAEAEDGKIVVPSYSPRKAVSDSVKSALKTFNFDIDKVLQENEVADEEVTSGGTSDNELAVERNRELSTESLGGWNNLSKKLRAYISLTTYSTNLNDFFGVEGVFDADQNVTLAVDIKRVYNGIAKATQNSLTPKEIMTKLIHYRNVATEAKPVIDKLLQDIGFPIESFLASGEYSEKALNQDNIDIYYAFVKGFNLHAFDHIFTEYDFERGLSRSYSSNRKASDQVQFSGWWNDFTKKRASWGKTPEEIKRYANNQIVPLLEKAKNAISVDFTNNKRESVPMTEADVSFRISTVREGLEAVGIKLSEGYLKFIVLNNPAYTAITPEQKSYVDSFSYNMKEDGAYLTATLKELSEHIAADKNPFKRTKQAKEAKVEGEAQVKEKEVEAGIVTRLLTMAKDNELFDETVSPNSYLNAENKTIYSLQKPTADSIITLCIARGRTDLLPLDYQSEFFEDHFLLNSKDFKQIQPYLKIIREDGGRVRNLKWNSVTKKYEVDTTQQTEKGVTFGSYKGRELALAEYSHYLDNRFDTLIGRGQLKVRPVLLDIMENASSLNYVPLSPVTAYGKKADGQIGITEDFKTAILKEVKREWDRIQRVKVEGTNAVNKKEGFNWGATDEKRADLRGYNFWHWNNLLTFNNSTLKQELLTADTFENYEAELLEQIDAYFTDQVNQHLEELTTLGVVRKKKDGNKVFYVNVLLDTRYGRRDVRNKKGEWISEKPEERKTQLSNMQAVRMDNPFTSEYAGDNIAQVFLSNYLNRLSYNQLIKGDAAEVVKNPIDWFKRAKGRNASGDSLYSEDMPETRFAVIGQRDPISNKIADPNKMFNVTNRLLDMNNAEDAKEFAEVLASIQNDTTLSDKEKEKKLADIRKKGKVDVADAQGYITAETYLNYLHGLGKLSKQTREIYNRISKGEKLSPKDLQILKDEGVMGNSLKVVYYDGVRYLKLSVQLLSRQETSVKVNGEWVARPGKEVKHNMLDQMEQHNINLVVPPSASKMLTENVIELNADDTFVVSNPENQISVINNLFGRLQQENPSNKTKTTLPTQEETIIEAEQDHSLPINYPFFPGVKTVGDLLKHFQDAKAKKVARSYVPVKNVIFALQQGKTIPNMGRLAKIMRDNLIRTGATGQLLEFFQVDENGVPAFDFANMPHTQAKFEALYNSHFNTVFKQVVSGYKTTLQSAFGHQLMYYIDDQGKEVIVNQAMFDANVPKYLADYKAGKLKTRELAYNKPRYDKDGKQIGTYAEFVMSAHFAEQYNLKPGDIIPEEIAYMFGVRIPSQDKHSAIALKLVDVLPGFTGSNAVFPHELVKLMGHDFDIDSMYIHRPAHYIKKVNNKPKFMVYGNTEDDAFEQYIRHYEEDKFVSLLVKEYLEERLSKYTTRGSQKEELEALLRDIKEQYALDQEDVLGKDEVYLATLKGEQKDLEEDLRNLERELTLRAMKELGLPSTRVEFEAKTKEEGELNPSVLDNQTLNAKMALHTNPGIRKVTSTPATIDAVEEILDAIAKAQGLSSYEEMDKLYDVSSLSALMQALESNRAGQESIGAAVNATQIFVRLKEFGVYLGEKMLARVPTINGFTGTGYTSYLTQEEQRVMDILSTLTSAMTDNPKYGFVKKLGLSIDVLSNVANLVSLGYNLKDSIFLVNQDYVRQYTDFVANKKNPLRPIGEKFVNPAKFFNTKLEEITNRLKELGANVSPDVLESFNFTSEELLEGLSKKERTKEEEIAYLVSNYKALKAYEALEPITRTYAKVGNVIKISKGTGASFEEEAFIVQTFEELGGKFYKDSQGKWQVGVGKQNKVMPNVVDIFKNHPAIKANLVALADKRSNTGKIAISQTTFFKSVMKGVLNNLKERLIDATSKKAAGSKAFLAFLTLRAYRLQQAGTSRALTNPTQLIYKLEDQQVTLADEYNILAEKYPELVGKSPALFSLGFNPETSNGFTGISYNNMKGNTEFEARLTNDLENLYNHKETRPFIIKLFNYLIAKDALQFKNQSFINIMPAELFKKFSAASEAVKTILNKDASEEEFKKLFGNTSDKLIDEFMEMYIRDYANSKDLMYVPDAISEENFPVTKNTDGSITFDLFKGWEKLTKDDIMSAIANSIDENGESLSDEQIRNNLKDQVKAENIETFLKNREQLNELFIITIEKVGDKNVTKIAFKDGFNIKGGTYVLVNAESSQVSKEGVSYIAGERGATGLKEGTRATYVLKPNLGDFFNKVVPYGQFIAESETITQNKLKKQDISEIDGDAVDSPSVTAAADRIIAQNRAKAQAAQVSKSIPTKKVISGVQTGVDSIGLEIAKNLGYETGGTAPREFLQEGTKDPSLASKYGVQEISPEAQADYTKRTGKTDPYTARTEQNVKNSDGTVYFFTPGDTMGRDATKREATKLNKPFIENPTGAQLKEWLVKNNIQVLNVAGNRGSKLTKEKEAEVRKVLEEALGKSTPAPTAPITSAPTSTSAITNITAAKAEEAESSLNLIDPNALPSRTVMEKNLAAARIAEGADIMSTPFAVKALSNEELTKEWTLKCFGK